MSFRFDLPSRIALFPLPGAVLMPRAKLPLHIFEPRYLQMLDDVLKTDHRLIGMIQPGDAGLNNIGSAGRVIAFSESDDNRMMISLRAVSRFRLQNLEEAFTPYQQGQVEWTDFGRDMRGSESDPQLDRPALIGKLQRYMDAHDLSADWDAASRTSDENLINSMAMMLPFSTCEKQALLEAKTLLERRNLLEGLLEFSLRGGEGEEQLQ